MSEWLNTKHKFWDKKSAYKPCFDTDFCPYGQLVEEFPITKKRTDFSCGIFGHDCPVFYMAEPFIDGGKLDDKEKKKRLINMHTICAKKEFARCKKK